MAIRVRFLAFGAGLWLILAPGAFASGTVGPDHIVPGQPEHEPTSVLDVPHLEEPWTSEPGPDCCPTTAAPLAESPLQGPDADAAGTPTTPPSPTAGPPAGPPAAVLEQPAVQYFMDRFTGSHKKVVEAWLQRSGRYLSMIRDVLRAHDLPEDLAFVAMIESGFNPVAVSRAGAKGLWQFMAGTARRYGLRVDQWVDERFDPERSTRAAAAYLRDLYAMFGSWALAQAAYNAGEMTIVRAIQTVQSVDFWELADSRFLRQETKAFVPQIVAATVIGRDPARYGFENPIPSRHPVDVVRVPGSTSLAVLAKGAGVPLEDLRALNPVLVRGATPPGGSYELRVPAGSRDVVLLALGAPTRAAVGARPSSHVARASVKAGRQSDIHVVRPRETLSSIAKQYGVSVGDVVRWNRLGQHSPIRPGDRLRVAESRSVAESVGRPGAR